MGIIGELTNPKRSAYSTEQTMEHSYHMGQTILEKRIKGCIVECGLAAGSNFAAMMLGAKNSRKGYGLDSFEGIQLAGRKDKDQPGIGDITHDVNVPDEDLLVTSGITAYSEERVRHNLTEWNVANYTLIQGWVQNTLPKWTKKIGQIAILRLDMDIYAPTRFALEQLFPSVSEGGVVIIDDYELDGCKLACDEYFESIGYEPNYLDIENSTPKYFFK